MNHVWHVHVWNVLVDKFAKALSQASRQQEITPLTAQPFPSDSARLLEVTSTCHFNLQEQRAAADAGSIVLPRMGHHAALEYTTTARRPDNVAIGQSD